jgi:hypothetical protein
MFLAFRAPELSLALNCKLPTSAVHSGLAVTFQMLLTHYLTRLTAEFLLALASTVILGSGSHRTHEQILLSDGLGVFRFCPMDLSAEPFSSSDCFSGSLVLAVKFHVTI